MFSDYSPGSCFFLPNGTFIYNKLLQYIRELYREHNFCEVITPNIFNLNLWKKSGHYKNYKENLFLIQNNSNSCQSHSHTDSSYFGLKPMNCPAHCLIFSHKTHSYKELPIRYADFGALHRNEVTGSLTGLTRVRRFQQDDAHIFCREDQVREEILGQLKMIDSIYGVFGFKYNLLLSTRPEKYMGDVEMWNKAEEALSNALKVFGKDFQVNKGDGAF